MTREDYEYIKSKCPLPAANIYYTIKKDEVVQIGYSSITITFRESNHERNIEGMTNIEKTPGFMFWHGSKESEEFSKLNKEAIANFFKKALEA